MDIITAAAPAVRVIHPADIEALIDTVKKGEFFSIYFKRVAPKCPVCGKADKKWAGMTHCPKCGFPLSLERETLAQKGVENPADDCDKPNGNGVSAELAKQLWGVLKYYDANAVNANGVKGAYRSCRIDNILRLQVKGVKYIVQ